MVQHVTAKNQSLGLEEHILCDFEDFRYYCSSLIRVHICVFTQLKCLKKQFKFIG